MTPAELSPPVQPDGRPSEAAFATSPGRCAARPRASRGPTWAPRASPPVRGAPAAPAGPLADPDQRDLRPARAADGARERPAPARPARRRARPACSILTSAGDGIYGVDVTDRVIFANPAAARMLGRSVEEMIGGFAHERWHHTRPAAALSAGECPICARPARAAADGDRRVLLDARQQPSRSSTPARRGFMAARSWARSASSATSASASRRRAQRAEAVQSAARPPPSGFRRPPRRSRRR